MQWPQIGRLMTVPGVNLIVAATFLAAVGDIRRFPNTNKLVGYLGLDPRVRQSGDQPAKHGRISKQGSAHGRHARFRQRHERALTELFAEVLALCLGSVPATGEGADRDQRGGHRVAAVTGWAQVVGVL